MVPDEMLFFLKTTKVTTLNKCLNFTMEWKNCESQNIGTVQICKMCYIKIKFPD